MAARYTVTVEGLDRITANFARAEVIYKGALNRTLRRIGKVLVPILKSSGITPVRTGKLRSTTIFTIEGGPDAQSMTIRQGARTIDGAFYGEFVREGTPPHIIRPRKAKALRFQIGDRVIFARKVNHPGTRPNKYHLRAMRIAKGQIDFIIADENAKIAAELVN